jgi:hypothetical protein
MGKGSLFCNGQFVNVNGSQLDSCVAALEAEFNIKVTGYANANCSGNQCNANAGASASCDMSPNAPPLSGGLLALGLGSVAAGIVRRRIRRRL